MCECEEFCICDIDIDCLVERIPHPAHDANKYSRGELTVVGGCSLYPGAATLAAFAGQRMGAGYVRVFCSEEALQALHVGHPSIVAQDWNGFDVRDSSLVTVAEGHPQACLVGSGMSGCIDVENRLFSSLMKNCAHPLVVDGGALSYLATEKGISAAKSRRKIQQAHGSLILTPHFGEAFRLGRAAGIDCLELKKNAATDRLLANFSRQLSKAFCATVVLKGPVTFISPYVSSHYGKDEEESIVYAMRFGTSALAKAGTGDVLAGMVGALLSQGMKVADACILASALHALSASKAAERLSDVCVVAEDVICYLPEIIRDMDNLKAQ